LRVAGYIGHCNAESKQLWDEEGKFTMGKKSRTDTNLLVGLLGQLRHNSYVSGV